MQLSHYEAAKPLSSLNNKLGIPVVILTTFVGTTVFATVEKEASGWLKIIVGLISVLSAVLASLQTFLQFSERAEKHRSTAARAGALRREIEQYFAEGNLESLPQDKIERLRGSIDNLSLDAPGVSQNVWQKTSRLIERDQ